MEHIKTIETRNLCESAKNGGCGECQTSCQSACKTSCGVANQSCENVDYDGRIKNRRKDFAAVFYRDERLRRFELAFGSPCQGSWQPQAD